MYIPIHGMLNDGIYTRPNGTRIVRVLGEHVNKIATTIHYVIVLGITVLLIRLNV